MTTQLEFARVPFAADLSSYGTRPAIIADGLTLTYQGLAERTADLAKALGTERRLIALAASNDVESLVAYLAALASGNPLILLPEDKPAALDSMIEAYDPDVVLRSANGRFSLDERRPKSRHELHPDLALLLSTSGSTGSPKLVRLSHGNLQANAESIATYLGLTSDDRAATTLPMSYCYGLSVINSHLLRGGTLVLTGLSVVDPCFWDLFRNAQATSFAAVPYTFELLERVGFAEMELPSLRYITQAGGRLAPEKVRAYAEIGKQKCWDLFIMYGQTEATARMGYLPPHLAADNPGAIGIPVPGGTFRIDPVDGLADGELIYSGPNVMLGYAQAPHDLAQGRTVTELRTGDLARRNDKGLYEVVGRRSRFLKIVGLRVDLGQVESLLTGLGVTAAAAGTDDVLTVLAEGTHDMQLLTKVLAQGIGLPRAAVDLRPVHELPRLGNGKVDYSAITALAGRNGIDTDPTTAQPEGQRAPGAPPGAETETIRRIFQEGLELTEIKGGDSFVSLGGDSLSFVAVSVRLERLLGNLPPAGTLGPSPTWKPKILYPITRDRAPAPPGRSVDPLPQPWIPASFSGP
ncbi:non-ribosomal peptide synthetase [Arthrobacter sp. MMS24-T111]